MKDTFEKDNLNNMFILSMVHNGNTVLVVLFTFFPPNLIFICPEIERLIVCAAAVH